MLGIELIADTVIGFEGKRGKVRSVRLGGGARVPAELVFNSQGSTPTNGLAKALHFKLNRGYVAVDNNQRTSKRRVYAAGDIAKHFAHQVVTAAHEGATAAQAANYDLYRADQRE